MNKIIAFFLAAAGVISLNVQAQTSDFVELIPTPYLQKDLTATAGLGIVSLPRYADGSEQRTEAFPLVDMEWKSGVFLSTISGFGFNLSQDPTWQYGVRLGALSNQEQSARNNSSGPGNATTDLSPALFGNYLIDQHYAILSSFQTGAGNEKNREGILASVGARYIDRLNATNRIYGILSTTWANARYMQDLYGVTQIQSVDYNFPIYDTKAGMLNIKFRLGWDYTIDKQWSLLTGGTLTHPLGDAGSSPIASDKTQVMAYTALYYKF